MAKFVFKLQKVLDVKTHKEEAIRNELQVLNYRIHHEDARLKNMKEEFEKTLNEFKDVQEQRLFIEELRYYQVYFAKIKIDIQNQLQKIEDLKQELETVRNRYIEASKEKKILEKLKDRDFDRFKDMMEKVEQGILDEIGINTFNLNKKKSEAV